MKVEGHALNTSKEGISKSGFVGESCSESNYGKASKRMVDVEKIDVFADGKRFSSRRLGIKITVQDEGM